MRHCVIHDSPWADDLAWCQHVEDNWHEDLSLDLTDCALDGEEA